MTPPILFSEKIKAARPANGAGYPVQISAWDMDDNFYFATPELPTTTPDGRTNLLSEFNVDSTRNCQRARLPISFSTGMAPSGCHSRRRLPRELMCLDQLVEI